jgi:SAM-dependent methyltransferase
MNLKAKIQRVAAVYRDVGISGIGHRVLRKLKRSDEQWAKAKAEADAAFDTEMGTQTGGIQKVADLTVVGENAKFGVDHIASDPMTIRAALARLSLSGGGAESLKKYTFIDLGSGKGRALILAALNNFRRVIGVEFAKELHEVAKENTARLSHIIELVNADATTFEFPNEPLIVYMFNPFGSVIVRKVADNLLASWKANPRPIQVVYSNPVHLSEFVGWQVIDSANPARLVPEPGKNTSQ